MKLVSVRGALVLILALAVALVGGASQIEAQGKGTIKIATQSPLSGGQAALGVANAKNIIADKDILAVIGHLNSGVAIPSSEVYKEVNLTMISPANTNPTVTDRGYANVYRVCGRDDVQGVVGSEFAHGTLKSKSVYILHDKTTYGQGVAEFFKADAEKKG